MTLQAVPIPTPADRPAWDARMNCNICHTPVGMLRFVRACSCAGPVDDQGAGPAAKYRMLKICEACYQAIDRPAGRGFVYVGGKPSWFELGYGDRRGKARRCGLRRWQVYRHRKARAEQERFSPMARA